MKSASHVHETTGRSHVSIAEELAGHRVIHRPKLVPILDEAQDTHWSLAQAYLRAAPPDEVIAPIL